MAGEIGALGVKFLYAPETTVGVRPTTGYATKATGATLDLADYIVEATGFGAEIETADVTPMSTPQYGRRRFIPLLYGNDGNINFNCNINKTSRDSWNAICAEHAALTGGKSMWWEVILPGDTDGYFFRGADLSVGHIGKHIHTVELVVFIVYAQYGNAVAVP